MPGGRADLNPGRSRSGAGVLRAHRTALAGRYTNVDLPDLSTYRLHRVIPDVDLDGIVVPGLTATFHRRAEGDRIHTVGVYRYAGTTLVMAWGYVGEAHCRYTAVRRPDGAWDPPRPGCPRVERIREGGRVRALRIGAWVLPAASDAAGAPLPSSGQLPSPDRPSACPRAPGHRRAGA